MNWTSIIPSLESRWAVRHNSARKLLVAVIIVEFSINHMPSFEYGEAMEHTTLGRKLSHFPEIAPSPTRRASSSTCNRRSMQKRAINSLSPLGNEFWSRPSPHPHRKEGERDRTHLLRHHPAAICDTLKAEDRLPALIPDKHPPTLVPEQRIAWCVHRLHLPALRHIVSG